MAPATGCLNYLADTGRMVARPVRHSLDVERETEVVSHDEESLACRGMLVQVHDSRVLGTGEAVGVVDNVAEEAVPPQEVSAVRHHSEHVLGHDSSVLPGLAIPDMTPEPRAGLLVANSGLLLVRIVQAQV